MKPIITLLLCAVLSAADESIIKESGFPLVVSVPCTDIATSSQITEIQKILAEYLLVYGYKKMAPFGAESYFGPIDFVTDDKRYPKYVTLSVGGKYNDQYNAICITTKGETKDGSYSGHSDKLACEIAVYLSKKVNTTRVNGAGKAEK